jgi:multidrug transporter EmrE-like cation transporter
MSITLSPTVAWLILIIAGLLEIVWSVSMKASAGLPGTTSQH